MRNLMLIKHNNNSRKKSDYQAVNVAPNLPDSPLGVHQIPQSF